MPAINMREKYLNWLSLIETDYITMFIKTWFTFLASLQELAENLPNTVGDSGILNNYKERIFVNIPINISDEFIENVLKAYIQSKDKVLNGDEFLKDYFQIFYSYNEKFSREFSYEYRGKITKLLLRTFTNNNEKNLKINLSDERRTFQNYFGEKIETGFSLSEEINDSKIFENKSLFIEKILSALIQKAENIVNTNSRLSDRGKQRRINFLKDECLRDIKMKLHEELDIKEIFPLRPNNAIVSLNPNTLEIQNKPQLFDEDLTKWFIDFAYKLRNILFHFIIDPMDKNWQLLFKYSYLALKHLTEENVKILQNR